MSIGSRTIAAIDIGTNSIHMVIAKMSPTGFEVITREKNPARLGEGGGDMKKLGDEAMERGISALTHMRRIADVHRANIFAVATSAVREAKNAEVFVDRAANEAGVDIQIISGIEEARLIHLGVLQALPLTDKRSILIDIGGGSTEVVIFDHLEELFTRSFKMGAVRLTNRFFPPDRFIPQPSVPAHDLSNLSLRRRQEKSRNSDTRLQLSRPGQQKQSHKCAGFKTTLNFRSRSMESSSLVNNWTP